MRAVIQRVTEARVVVESQTVGEIDEGLLVLIGIASGDQSVDVEVLVARVAGMRIFSDANLKMNLSVADIGGSVLVVSQFTLHADIRRGRRPSFTAAASPAEAEPLIEEFCTGLRERGIDVAQGIFGAQMKVELVNDGPVTIVADIVGGQVV